MASARALVIEIENLEGFIASFEQAVAEVEAEFARAYRMWASSLFAALAKESPQWSGNFAANWNIQLDAESTRYEQITEYAGDEWANYVLTGFSVRFRGNQEAVETALARNTPTFVKAASLPARELLRKTFFVNNLTPYADAWANEPSEVLRPGNYIDPAPVPVHHVVLTADMHWAKVSQGGGNDAQ